jgi:hypothetical protein
MTGRIPKYFEGTGFGKLIRDLVGESSSTQLSLGSTSLYYYY